MTIGFPASYSERIEFDGDRRWAREAIVETLDDIGWRYENPHPDKFTARVPISGSSWGERVTIRFTSDGAMEVESSCRPFLQIIDWGKNRKNVENFLALFEAKAARTRKFRSLAEPAFDTGSSTPLERALDEEGS